MSDITNEDKPKKSSKKLSKFHRHLLIFVVGILVSFAVTTAVRFALIKDTTVHYHANFSLYVNGQEDPFKSFAYYEEVASCDSHQLDNPKVRTHMHDNNSHLIHVHAHAVTWGAFFDNLDYALGDTLIQTAKGVYVDGADGNKLTFTLNGEPVTNIANKVIQSEDVLLINYGKDTDATLKQRYNAIPRDAHKANVTKDPAACSGGHELTFWKKLKQAVGIPSEEH